MILGELLSGIHLVFWEALQALLPLLGFFLVFQVAVLRWPLDYMLRTLQGMVLALLGLTLFLHGVYVGFMPSGELMGELLGRGHPLWLPLAGAALGFCATIAEPAVRVLGHQVEDASGGHISGKILVYTLSLGVALAVGISMVRIVWGFPVQALVVPGYLLVLVLLYFSNPEFTAIAFDAGGVATGPMTVTFVMAVAVGTATALEGRDPVMDGFGLIAMVALAPILTVMVLGLVYARKEAEEDMEKESAHDLVVAIMKRGWAETVIKAAKSRGASGGTILCGRGSWEEKEKKLLGVPIEPEREAILTVVHSELTDAVIDAMVKAGHLERPNTGIVFAVPLKRVEGLGHHGYEDEPEGPGTEQS